MYDSNNKSTLKKRLGWMVLYLLPLIQLIEKFPIWTVSCTRLLPAAGGCSERALGLLTAGLPTSRLQEAKGVQCCPCCWRQQWATSNWEHQNTRSLPFFTRGTLNSSSAGIYGGHLNLPTAPVSKSSDFAECWAPAIPSLQQNLWAPNPAKEPRNKSRDSST